MWRSDSESRSLKTYVPAGNTCAPTPGTSTGALNVTTVFLFQSSADAPGNINKETAMTQTTTRHFVKTFIGTFSLRAWLTATRSARRGVRWRACASGNDETTGWLRACNERAETCTTNIVLP